MRFTCSRPRLRLFLPKTPSSKVVKRNFHFIPFALGYDIPSCGATLRSFGDIVSITSLFSGLESWPSEVKGAAQRRLELFDTSKS